VTGVDDAGVAHALAHRAGRSSRGIAPPVASRGATTRFSESLQLHAGGNSPREPQGRAWEALPCTYNYVCTG
jgi:hypothetical protein